MSIVGTRPPLIGEVSEYELHHRARLAIKPGITGMWQVSGRSDITDFEEVVELDKEYIVNMEINGFSGSPVWSLEADEKTIVGLFTSGVGRSIYRGKVHALKMEAMRL